MYEHALVSRVSPNHAKNDGTKKAKSAKEALLERAKMLSQLSDIIYQEGNYELALDYAENVEFNKGMLTFLGVKTQNESGSQF